MTAQRAKSLGGAHALCRNPPLFLALSEYRRQPRAGRCLDGPACERARPQPVFLSFTFSGLVFIFICISVHTLKYVKYIKMYDYFHTRICAKNPLYFIKKRYSKEKV